LRTSWVIGEGENFVRTIAALADRGIDPKVVDDQMGRLTFASDIAAAIRHLLDVRPSPGIYNLTASGEPVTWADVAKRVFELCGHDPKRVTGVSTDDYFADRQAAPRPKNSLLALEKITATGFSPSDMDESLTAYLCQERSAEK